MLQNGDLIEYKKRTRLLRIRTVDDSVQKVMQVDDSRTLAELMLTICEKLNIRSHTEEYSVIRQLSEEETRKTLTLRKGVSIAKDQEKLDRMKKKLQTDDECTSCFAFALFGHFFLFCWCDFLLLVRTTERPVHESENMNTLALFFLRNAKSLN